MIRRSITPYLVTLTLCGFGLWFVLEQGRHLRAPEHLAGRWVDVESSNIDPADGDVLPLHISQSGRFFQLAEGYFSARPFTLQSQHIHGEDEPYRAVLELTDGETTWRIEGPVVPDSYLFERIGTRAFRRVLRRTSEIDSHTP